MKNHLSRFGIYLIIYEGGILIGLLFCMIVMNPLKLAFEMSDAVQNLIWGLISTAGTSLWLFIASHREGHKVLEFKLSDVLIPTLMVFALQQIVAVIFQYAIYFTGGALFFAKAFGAMAGSKYAYNEDIPVWLKHICMLGYDILFFIPSILCGSYFGTKKRLKDRAELIGGNKD